MSCTHPHIFRMQVKDPYRCLACGETIKVTPYENTPVFADKTAVPEQEQHELWHMIEVDKKDIHILHVSGCDSWGKDTDPKCRVMIDLITNKPGLAMGEYDAYADGSAVIQYVPRKKLNVTKQRQLHL